MSDRSVIVKLEDVCVQDHPKIKKVIGTIDAANIAKLIDKVGLEANPRRSKVGRVTEAITETLEKNPGLMRFKSKGLLISTTNCDTLERNRFRLSFDNPRYEGVLDGGHNILAIALFILSKIESEYPIRRIRRWDELQPVWEEIRDQIGLVLQSESFEDFQVPIEILYPAQNLESNDFIDAVLEISDARNNNAELTAETKAHHSGYYDDLKNALAPEITINVEWTTNEIGRHIKSADIAALTLIPMLVLQNRGLLDSDIPPINPVNIYSSKSKCVQIFNEIMESVEDEDGKGNKVAINSALVMMKDIPRLYDLIYALFPEAYNSHSQRFGGIKSVKIYDGDKRGESYLSKPAKTKFYADEVRYQYPDGFILPIVCSLTELMEVDSNGILRWQTDPDRFIKDNLDDCLEIFVHMIKSNNYDPQTVGKNTGAYLAMQMSFRQALTKR